MDATMDAIISKWELLAGPDRAAHRALMAEAGETFNVDPDPEANPRQVLAVRPGGDPEYLQEAWICFVTAGGLKIRWPLDGDTEDRLRRVFGCFVKRWNPRTRQDETITLPLPDDLRLPAEQRTGIVPPKKVERP